MSARTYCALIAVYHSDAVRLGSRCVCAKRMNAGERLCGLGAMQAGSRCCQGSLSNVLQEREMFSSLSVCVLACSVLLMPRSACICKLPVAGATCRANQGPAVAPGRVGTRQLVPACPLPCMLVRGLLSASSVVKLHLSVGLVRDSSSMHDGHMGMLGGDRDLSGLGNQATYIGTPTNSTLFSACDALPGDAQLCTGLQHSMQAGRVLGCTTQPQAHSAMHAARQAAAACFQYRHRPKGAHVLPDAWCGVGLSFCAISFSHLYMLHSCAQAR